MKSLVFGATGYVGREVVRIAAMRGHDVVAHIRDDSSRADEWSESFAALGATASRSVWNKDAIDSTAKEASPEVVYLLLGTTRHRAKGEGDVSGRFRRVDWELTKLAVDAAVGCGNSPLLCYLSSVGASQESRSEYLRIRGQMEAYIKQCGLPWVIARPSFITGPGRDDSRWGERAAAVATNGALGMVGLFGGKKIRAKYRSATNTEVATALVAACEDSSLQGMVLEGSDLRALY